MDTELGRKICVIAFGPRFCQPATVHVATFDAAEDKDYNRENCEKARDLFASQPGVTIKYWCERGRFTQ